MGYELQKFSAGTLNKGVDSQQMQFLPVVLIDPDSYNMTTGIQVGSGPRYGISTIPGMADNETIAGTRLPGLRAAEGTPSQGFSGRLKVLAVYPIKLPDPSNIALKVTAYAWLVTTVQSGTEYFDIVLSSTYAAGFESISTAIYAGLGYTSYGTNTTLNYFGEAYAPVSGSRNAALVSNLVYAGGKFLSSAVIAVTGTNVATQWLFGEALAAGDATHAPSAGFHKSTSLQLYNGTAGSLAGGVPSEYNLGNFTTTPRNLVVWGLLNTGNLNLQYTVIVPTPTTSIYKPDIFGDGIVTLDLSATTAVKLSAGTTYSSNRGVLVNDPASVTNASYKAILVAAQKPMACLFQDSFRSENSGGNGKTNQWFDLTQNSFQPQTFISNYFEDGSSKATSFNAFPDFIRGTALSGGSYRCLLGPADSGVLKSKTVYEFTYSIYNKRLNFETNVGIPVKIQTGTDNNVSLQWYAGTNSHDNFYNVYVAAVDTMLLPPFSPSAVPVRGTTYQNFGNHLQYRFYYRVEGTFEWLPALFIDVTQWWFYPWPNGTGVFACTGPIQALPGGQPGGFNDYSPLPKDNYNCVVQYKDRAFWLSDKAIVFSLRKNIFSYPGRNSISAVGGEFRGALIHNYPGAAEQSSRMVIFGSDQIYVARFSGNLLQTNVQVSADNSYPFDLDGSDLVIDPWTSVTAFSYRSAVIADGILYYWGPQGVYRDDGVQTPTKISGPLEPDIFEYYDHSKTSEIHGNYNSKTKEITWFYPPKSTADGQYTRTLIWDVAASIWQRGQMPFKVDWEQNLDVVSDVGTAGNRVVTGLRETPSSTLQRAYFWDERNRAGDMHPKTDFIVKTVTTPVAGTRRLTLAAGYDATNFATMAAGDRLAIQQFNQYTGQTTGSDLIARISAVSTGSGYLDITLPTGAVLPNIAATYDQYFPIWQAGTGTTAGLNSIAYQMKTNYWAPAGVNGYFFWLYCYLLAKVNLWISDLAIGPSLGYRTPTASGTVTDLLALTDNNDGNWQIYHPLTPGNDNAEGQAIRFIFSGNHIGHEWVLQYMEAHATPIPGDTLKRFEG